MDAILCSITRNQNIKDTILFKSLQNINIEWYIEHNNTTKGLGQFYNECIKNYSHKDTIIFVHDDVEIITTDIINQLSNAFKKYDVVGVAGCVNPKIIEKNLWHWMAQTKDNLRGIAGHPVDSESFYVTSFGPTPSRVAIIDGVFMALKTKKILETQTKFDEQFMFHHYDIDFSLTCNKNKVKIGVWPILINHQSPGLREFDNRYEASNANFIKKWNKI